MKFLFYNITQMEKSYHIFYYTFLWYDMNNLILQSNPPKSVWSKLNDFKSNNKWIRKQEVIKSQSVDEAPAYFNEMCYFYEYTHHILFDKNKKTHVLHFERIELEKNNSDVRYIIETKGKTYDLKIDKISLDLYELGVGILSFYLDNDMENFDSKDVCAINYYGRCIYVPFWEDQKQHECIPCKLSIVGLGNEYVHEYELSETSNKDSLTPWSLPKHIHKLLWTDLLCRYSTVSINPALDNRMFVSCWYYNDDLTQKITLLDLKTEKNGSVLVWKSLYGIDELKPFDEQSSSQIDNEEICNHTYTLWQKAGTLYGHTRYSFVILTNTLFTKMHMQTLYSRILKLVLLQKSSVLYFSKDISVLSLNQDNEEYLIEVVRRIYNQYITFLNHIYFDDITPQPQGTDFYNILQKELEIGKSVAKLNHSIEEVYNSLSTTMYASKRDRQSRALNWIAVLFLPPSLVTGFCGMSQLWYKEFTFDLFVIECLWSIAITLMLALFFWIITRPSDKKKKHRPFL